MIKIKKLMVVSLVLVSEFPMKVDQPEKQRTTNTLLSAPFSPFSNETQPYTTTNHHFFPFTTSKLNPTAGQLEFTDVLIITFAAILLFRALKNAWLARPGLKAGRSLGGLGRVAQFLGGFDPIFGRKNTSTDLQLKAASSWPFSR